MQQRIKRILRWAVMAAAILFLGRTLRGHWAEVLALQIQPDAAGRLGASLGMTLLAHGWSGWAWSWILQALQQPVGGRWSMVIYLKTNLLKYLPGNIWHFYGRIQALRSLGIATVPAILGVVLDPVLMAAAALLVGLAKPTIYWPGQLALLTLVLAGLHPNVLNPLLRKLSQGKAKSLAADHNLDGSQALGASPTASSLPGDPNSAPALLTHYPLKPLMGEVGFVLLRGLGFGLIVSALSPLPQSLWPTVISRFSLAWLAGLIVPGAPGGLGVVEALAVPLLQDTLPVAVILSAVVLYRLISTLAEAIGAGIAQALNTLR
ncbi:MAG: UPF0104 family protein [Spirulina sp.]